MIAPSALIFDMDGLLVDSEPRSESALEQLLARRMLALDPDLAPQLLGRRLPEAIAIVQDWFDLTDSVQDLTAEFSELRLEALRQRLPVMPGARELLDWAHEEHVPMALATSSRRSHADVSLASTGLADAFDIQVTGDDVERGKPAPDLFLLAASRLGIDPVHALVFEDAPAGIAAARAAGMRAIWIPNQYSRNLPMPVQPDDTFASLIEAHAWLMRLASDWTRNEQGSARAKG